MGCDKSCACGKSNIKSNMAMIRHARIGLFRLSRALSYNPVLYRRPFTFGERPV